jgi:hypothetical protein
MVSNFNRMSWRPWRNTKPIIPVAKSNPLNPVDVVPGWKLPAIDSYRGVIVPSPFVAPKVPGGIIHPTNEMPSQPPPDPQAQYKVWLSQYAQPIIDEMMAGGMPNGSESASFYETFGNYLDAAARNKGKVQIGNASELADMMAKFALWQEQRKREAAGRPIR